MRHLVVVVMALVGALCGACPAEDSTALAAAQAAAQGDGHPLLVLVRDEDDDQAIALGYRLQDAALHHRLPGAAHLALLWRQDPAASAFPGLATEGLSSCLACLGAGAAAAPALRVYALPRSAALEATVLAQVIEGVAPAPPPAPLPADDLALAYVRCTQGDGRADPQARAQLIALVAARLASPAAAAQVAWLDYLVYLAEDAGLRHRFETVVAAMPQTHDVLNSEFDLADEALSAGEGLRASLLYGLVQAGREVSPVLAHGAAAMQALPQEADCAVRRAWEARRCWDGVVLVHDRASFCAAISCWTPTSYFPVLFDEDQFAPRFIAAFHPAQVLRLRPDPSPVDADRLRGALLASWSAPSTAPSAQLMRSRLRELGLSAHGLVLTTTADDACTAALALAAARFQGLEVVSGPADADRHVLGVAAILSYAQATQWSESLDRALDSWVPASAAWRFLTLCGPYPYRWSGNQEAYDHINCVDDLIGRDQDRTRTAVVGRLVEQAPGASTYQAMCALFLQPQSSLGFDTYQQNPFSSFGDNCLAAFAPGQPGQLPGTWLVNATITDLQAAVRTWNQADAVYLASAGGPDWWLAHGQRGTTEDMPIGVPSVVQVEHSYSAADPWDPDTLAGRFLWGGAYVYTGSVAEPFLNAFQSPRYLAPRLAMGLPLAALMRTHAGEFKAKPWRLIYLGDPQFCWRRSPLQRVPGPPPVPAASCEALDCASAAPIDQLRLATRLGASARLPQLVAQLVDTPGLDVAQCRLALSCALQDGTPDSVRQLWMQAAPAVRGDAQVRRLARIGLAEQLARARRAQDLPRYFQTWIELVATAPQREHAQRLLADGTALAETLHAQSSWSELLAGAALPAPYAALLHPILTEHHLEVLLGQERWQDADASAAQADLRQLSADGTEPERLLSYLDRASLQVARRQAGGAEAFLQALRGPPTPGPALATALDQLAKRRSYFRDWLILGPLPDGEVRISRAVEQGSWQPAPAPPAVPGEPRWLRPFVADDRGYVDLNQVLGAHDHVHAYARCRLEAPHAVHGDMLLGSDDGATVLLDGVAIHHSQGPRGLTPDQDVIPFALTAGSHELLLRIDQIDGDWGFCLRLASSADHARPLPVVLRNPLDAAPASPP